MPETTGKTMFAAGPCNAQLNTIIGTLFCTRHVHDAREPHHDERIDIRWKDGAVLTVPVCATCKGMGVVERSRYEAYEASGRDVEFEGMCDDCEGTGLQPAEEAAHA